MKIRVYFCDVHRKKPPSSPRKSASTSSGDDGIRVSSSVPMNIPPSTMNELSGSSADTEERKSASTKEKPASGGKGSDGTDGIRVKPGPEETAAGSGEHPVCSLCDSKADLCFWPCSHIDLCQDCGGRAKRCSVCKVCFRLFLCVCVCMHAKFVLWTDWYTKAMMLS